MEKHAFDPACCLGERLQTLSRAELTALAETICRILTERGRTAAGNGQPSVFFLPFAQRGPSIHLRQTKNALKSEIAKLKMQQNCM